MCVTAEKPNETSATNGKSLKCQSCIKSSKPQSKNPAQYISHQKVRVQFTV